MKDVLGGAYKLSYVDGSPVPVDQIFLILRVDENDKLGKAARHCARHYARMIAEEHPAYAEALINEMDRISFEHVAQEMNRE